MEESEPGLDQIEKILIRVRDGDVGIGSALTEIEAIISGLIESAIADEKEAQEGHDREWNKS